MPVYTRYPNATDVENLLKTTTFWPEGADDSAPVLLACEQATIAARAASDRWENDTGWRPFLCTSEEGTSRSLNIDREDFHDTGVIQLEGGILRLDSVTLDEKAVASSEIFLEPSDGPYNERPYSWLYLPRYKKWPATYLTDYPVRVEVTGAWGFCTTVPENAWQLMLVLAARITLAAMNQEQDIQEIVQDGFSKAYDIVGVETQKDRSQNWGREWQTEVRKYARNV